MRLPAQLLDFRLQDFASAALVIKVLFDTHEFKHLLNPVGVRVFFISLHKRVFVNSAPLSALQRIQQYIRFGSQIT